jgi:hypothetical protein
MSERTQGTARLTADDRYDLAVASGAASRRNKPSHLVVLAGVIFVAACGVLGFTSCEASRADDRLDARASQLESIASMLAEIKAMEQAADPDAEAANEPYPGFRSKVEEIAKQVGLSGELPFPNTNRPTSGIPGVSHVTFDYDVSEPDLAMLLAFAETTTEQIPGTRIASIELRPRAEEWEMKIRFERWERTN